MSTEEDLFQLTDTDARICVMGGMFDPVHEGHLHSALLAKEAFKLDHIIMVPCGSPVHRLNASASGEDRVAMLNLAIQGHKGLTVDERECKSVQPSYTFNTLDAIKKENPSSRLFFLFGVDSFNTLPTWHRWQEIFDLVNLLVIKRPGWRVDVPAILQAELASRQVASIDEMSQFSYGKILIQGLAPYAISSSEVRATLQNRHSLEGLVPTKVIDYINTSALYEATGA